MTHLEIESSIKEYLSQFPQIKTCGVRVKPNYIKICFINNTNLHISSCYLFGSPSTAEAFSSLIFNDITLETFNEIQSFIRLIKQKHWRHLVDNAKIKGKIFEFDFLYEVREQK